MKSIVVAYDVERTIGLNGRMPWEGELPADLRHFKELTEGFPVIMGSRTYYSLPDFARPLSNRQNIVLSRSIEEIEGADVVHDLDEAYEIAGENAFIIGGADVYRQALPTVNRVFATEIMARTIGGDAFFPALPKKDWEMSDIQDFEAAGRNKYPYSFITYLRRNPIQ